MEKSVIQYSITPHGAGISSPTLTEFVNQTTQWEHNRIAETLIEKIRFYVQIQLNMQLMGFTMNSVFIYSLPWPTISFTIK